MESFGLFDLLKSMLLFKGDSNVPKTTTASTTTPNSTAERFPQSVSAQPNTESVNNSTPIEPTPVPNAYLEFLNRHDELAKRRKRK